MAKLLDIVPGEGNRTNLTVLGTAIINVIIIVCELIGLSLPDGMWEGINVAFGLLITLFLGDKVARTEKLAQDVSAKQPNETPVVVINANGEVRSNGVDIVQTQ